jgi:integrase
LPPLTVNKGGFFCRIQTNLSKKITLATTKVLMGHKSVITTMKYYNYDEGLVNIYAEQNGIHPSKVESDL